MFQINNIISHLLTFVKKEFYKMLKKELFYEAESTSWTALSDELTEKYGLIISGVYGKLLDVCPRGTTTVNVRQEWLAKKLHLSRKTVNESLKKLEEIGLISKTKNSRASTYEIKPIINVKGRLKQDYTPESESPSEGRWRPVRGIRKKRPVHDIIREQEMEEIHKYLDLVD